MVRIHLSPAKSLRTIGPPSAENESEKNAAPYAYQPACDPGRDDLAVPHWSLIGATLALGRAIAICSGLTLAIGPGNAPQQSDVVQRGTVQLRCEHAEIGAVADRSRSGSGKRRRRAAILSPSLPWVRLPPLSGLHLPSAQLLLRLLLRVALLVPSSDVPTGPSVFGPLCRGAPLSDSARYWRSEALEERVGRRFVAGRLRTSGRGRERSGRHR
jgi:hypothetical protein